jgi:protein-S-isoprenylcysteine O-methyltransferase Ste14
MEYVALIILWILWCIIHSGMISVTMNDFAKKRLRSSYKYYRLFYNLFATATLIPVLLYSLSLKGDVIFRWEGNLAIVQFFLLLIALSLFLAGGMQYDMQQFIGIRQIRSGKSCSALSDSCGIGTSGILRVTRHPWYLAAIIFVWIWYREMYVSTLIVNCILTMYLIIGTILEERKLVLEMGDAYRDYQKRVSMLFPLKWILSKFARKTKPSDAGPGHTKP